MQQPERSEIFIFSGLSLARFKITAETLVVFVREFFTEEIEDTEWLIMLFKLKSGRDNDKLEKIMHQSIPAVPIPPPPQPWGICFVVSPGGGAFAILSRARGLGISIPPGI